MHNISQIVDKYSHVNPFYKDQSFESKTKRAYHFQLPGFITKDYGVTEAIGGLLGIPNDPYTGKSQLL